MQCGTAFNVRIFASSSQGRRVDSKWCQPFANRATPGGSLGVGPDGGASGPCAAGAAPGEWPASKDAPWDGRTPI